MGWLSLSSFIRDQRGASAVEFAIVALPFLLVLLMILQMGIYYMTQSALDAGTIQTADSLVNTFYNGTTPTVPTPAALKTMVTAGGGGLVHNDATLSVDLRLLSALGAAVVPIGNTVDTSVPGSILALRSQAQVTVFMPGFASLAMVRSSALVRRQGY